MCRIGARYRAGSHGPASHAALRGRNRGHLALFAFSPPTPPYAIRTNRRGSGCVRGAAINPSRGHQTTLPRSSARGRSQKRGKDGAFECRSASHDICEDALTFRPVSPPRALVAIRTFAHPGPPHHSTMFQLRFAALRHAPRGNGCPRSRSLLILNTKWPALCKASSLALSH